MDAKRKIIQGIIIALVVFINLDVFIRIEYIDKILFSVFVLAVLVTRSWEILHCAVLFLLLSLQGLASKVLHIGFPAVVLLLIFLLATLIIVPFRPARKTLAWASPGQIDRSTFILLAVTVVVSTASLVFWANWTDDLGFGLAMMQGLAEYPNWLVLFVMIPLFAVINALAEEIVFRGVLLQALLGTFDRVWAAVLLHASCFAVFHFLAGFPNGIAGYIMVFVYGIMLGYLRIKSRGLLVPFIAHGFADLVIGYLLFHFTHLQAPSILIAARPAY